MLLDCTNNGNSHAALIKKWKKLACESSTTLQNSELMMSDRRLSLEVADLNVGKKLCATFCSSFNKENFKVVAGSQLHRS